MKKRTFIVLTTTVIIVLTGFISYSFLADTNKKTESIVIDKDGEVVEPLSDDSDNIGH
ncbi:MULTISPECIES: hypothetical protein [unclassified Virgibacillus]|uniref:hypothetical protein n=1 Tax=unclassified Virgibacillus TaxID=2620237 RepID=UPI0024DE55F7|nr:hypothetical protein [Virgibacillus sp. LDC-1]